MQTSNFLSKILTTIILFSLLPAKKQYYYRKIYVPKQPVVTGPKPLSSYLLLPAPSNYFVPERHEYQSCDEDDLVVAKAALVEALGKMQLPSAPGQVGELTQHNCARSFKNYDWFRLFYTKKDAEKGDLVCEVYVVASYLSLLVQSRFSRDSVHRFHLNEEFTARANNDFGRCTELVDLVEQEQEDQSQAEELESREETPKVWRDEDLKVVPYVKPQVLVDEHEPLVFSHSDFEKQSPLIFAPSEFVKPKIPDFILRSSIANADNSQFVSHVNKENSQPTQRIWRDEDLKVVPYVKPQVLVDEHEPIVFSHADLEKLKIHPNLSEPRLIHHTGHLYPEYLPSFADIQKNLPPTRNSSQRTSVHQEKVWRDEDLKVVPYVKPKTLIDEHEPLVFSHSELAKSKIPESLLRPSIAPQSNLQIVPYRPLILPALPQNSPTEVVSSFGPAAFSLPLHNQVRKSQAASRAEPEEEVFESREAAPRISKRPQEQIMGGWNDCQENEKKKVTEAWTEAIAQNKMSGVNIYTQNVAECRRQMVNGLNYKATISLNGKRCFLSFYRSFEGETTVHEEAQTEEFPGCVQAYKYK